MSTAGSDPSAPATPRVAIFRWRGIFALAFGLAVVATVWLIFGKLWIRHTLQDSATQSLGTEVDVAGLGLDLINASVELRGIAIADPRDLNRNLIEARVARVVLLPDALVEKKIVIRELTLDGVRANTRRAKPARAMKGGFAPRAMQALTQWRQQFNVPLLSLTPVDTIKALVLDPTQAHHGQAGERTQDARRFVARRPDRRSQGYSTSRNGRLRAGAAVALEGTDAALTRPGRARATRSATFGGSRAASIRFIGASTHCTRPRALASIRSPRARRRSTTRVAPTTTLRAVCSNFPRSTRRTSVRRCSVT